MSVARRTTESLCPVCLRRVAAERVARDVLSALESRRRVVYTPWFWRPVMALLRALPAPIFRRLPI